MGILSVNQKYRVAYFRSVGHNRLVDERESRSLVPPIVGVERTLVIAPGRFVVCVIILDELRRIIRKSLCHASSQSVCAVAVIFCALCVQLFAQSCTRLGIVCRIEISVCIYPAHVIHCRSHGRFDSSIQSRRVYGHASPSADTEDANALRVYVCTCGEIVYRSAKIFGVDVGRGYITGFSAAFSCK